MELMTSEVKAAANGNVDVTQKITHIDGVRLDWGDKFLLPRQENWSEVGVYVVDQDRSVMIGQPARVKVHQGTVNCNAVFRLGYLIESQLSAIPDPSEVWTMRAGDMLIMPPMPNPDALIREYADKITSINEKGTDGDYTWLGLLAEFTMKLQGRM